MCHVFQWSDLDEMDFFSLVSCFAGFLSLDGTFITLSPLARWSSLGKLSFFFFSLSVGKNKNSEEEWCQGRWAENGKVRYDGDEARREWIYANFNVKQLARLCSVAMVSKRVTDNMTTDNFEEIQTVGGQKFMSCDFWESRCSNSATLNWRVNYEWPIQDKLSIS